MGLIPNIDWDDTPTHVFDIPMWGDKLHIEDVGYVFTRGLPFGWISYCGFRVMINDWDPVRMHFRCIYGGTQDEEPVCHYLIHDLIDEIYHRLDFFYHPGTYFRDTALIPCVDMDENEVFEHAKAVLIEAYHFRELRPQYHTTLKRLCECTSLVYTVDDKPKQRYNPCSTRYYSQFNGG